MAFKGIIEALNKGPVGGSPLYVWTDAPPKDTTDDNIEEATNRAKLLGINVYFFLTTGCVDPSSSLKPFEKLARDTCGQVFELPKDSSSIAKMKKVTKHLLSGHLVLAMEVLQWPSYLAKRSEVFPRLYIDCSWMTAWKKLLSRFPVRTVVRRST